MLCNNNEKIKTQYSNINNCETVVARDSDNNNKQQKISMIYDIRNENGLIYGSTTSTINKKKKSVIKLPGSVQLSKPYFSASTPLYYTLYNETTFF